MKLEQAARTLGLAVGGCFTITLPLTLPGIIVGTVLAFARSQGSLAPPLPLSPISGETRTIPSAMYTLIQTPGGEGLRALMFDFHRAGAGFAADF